VRLLWTLSNWKRTGPVEPSLDLAAAMQAGGHDVEVLVGRAPRGHEDHAAAAAKARGLTLADVPVALGKHRFPPRDVVDRFKLRRALRVGRYDAVVTTLRGDHRLLEAARRRAAPHVPLVRLFFGDGLRPLERDEARCLRKASAVLVPGAAPRRRLEESGVRPECLHDLHPALDIAGLAARVGDLDHRRDALGLAPDTFVFGIVARMQRHRRFELLWEACARLHAEGHAFKVLAVGRGTYAETVAYGPVKARGLDTVVHFPGYLRGEAYATTMALFDAQFLLVPGSDPTCRALREGMALGNAPIVLQRGLLPEIVDSPRVGWAVPESAAALADAMREALEDRAGTRARGEAAKAQAARRYDASGVAERLGTLLQSLAPGTA